MNDTLASFLATVAPTLASAVLGPLGGVAVAGLGKILGIDAATTENVTKAITDGKITPEQMAEIRKLEMQYKNDEAERGFKYSELEFKNTQSAREMQIATHSPFPAWLSAGITAGFFGILGWMLYDESITNSEPILIMLGSLGAAFGAVVNYWLGSNSGSARTKELLAQAQPLK
jgi:hypothetical protein